MEMSCQPTVHPERMITGAANCRILLQLDAADDAVTTFDTRGTSTTDDRRRRPDARLGAEAA